MAVRVLVADDHLIVRQGFGALLERAGFEVVALAADGREAVRLAEQHQPDVALLDLAMPLLNGLDAAREIVRVSPRTRPVLLTMHAEDQYVVEALRAGVRGYVLKTQAAEDLIQAVQQAASGAVYLSSRVAGALAKAHAAGVDTARDPLSPREREILQLIAEGKTAKEIGFLLGLSAKTVESHRARIAKKLGIHETAGLVCYAIRRGLIRL